MVQDFLDLPRGANDYVAFRVQKCLGGSVVHHKRVTGDGLEDVGDIHKGWPLVPQNWLHDLEILGGLGVVWSSHGPALPCCEGSTCFLG